MTTTTRDFASIDSTRTLRFSLAHEIIGEACDAARRAVADLEELPYSESVWRAIEDIDQAAEALRSVIPEENLGSLSLFLLSLRGRLESAMIATCRSSASDAEIHAHAAALDGSRRVIIALMRVAPIAQRPAR